jgi:hypothetical protein
LDYGKFHSLERLNQVFLLAVFQFGLASLDYRPSRVLRILLGGAVSNSQSFRPHPVSTPPLLAAPLLSWGYRPSQSLIGSGATARIGCVIPPRPSLRSDLPELDPEVFTPLPPRCR